MTEIHGCILGILCYSSIAYLQFLKIGIKSVKNCSLDEAAHPNLNSVKKKKWLNVCNGIDGN